MTSAFIHEIGRVARYFNHASVASVRLQAPLRVGEWIYIRGWTTDFTQVVGSIQREHIVVERGNAGELVGIHVVQRCRKHDIVYRLEGTPANP
jgi:hypothetical protein